MILDVEGSSTTVFSKDRIRHTADVWHLKTKCQWMRVLKHVLFDVDGIR